MGRAAAAGIGEMNILEGDRRQQRNDGVLGKFAELRRHQRLGGEAAR